MNDVRIITGNLSDQIIPALSESNSVYMVVSFTMASGVRMLLDYLKSAVGRGVDIKILSGDYLHVTDVAACFLCRRFSKCHCHSELKCFQSL